MEHQVGRTRWWEDGGHGRPPPGCGIDRSRRRVLLRVLQRHRAAPGVGCPARDVLADRAALASRPPAHLVAGHRGRPQRVRAPGARARGGQPGVRPAPAGHQPAVLPRARRAGRVPPVVPQGRRLGARVHGRVVDLPHRCRTQRWRRRAEPAGLGPALRAGGGPGRCQHPHQPTGGRGLPRGGTRRRGRHDLRCELDADEDLRPPGCERRARPPGALAALRPGPGRRLRLPDHAERLPGG